MPQKHPPASTTVSELLVLLSGSSAAGFGSFTAALDAWQATVLRRMRIGSSRTSERIFIKLFFPELTAQWSLDRNAALKGGLSPVQAPAHAFFLNVSEAEFMQ